MLRITTSTSIARAKSYFSTADYYAEGQELVGVWQGKGAARLGLRGEIRKADWDRLCSNRHPETGKRLTVRDKQERRVGYDFTFDVDKSISLLYGLTGDERILAAFCDAVDATMRDIETEAAVRVRAGGADTDRVTGNLVWGRYLHFTSRPVNGVPDPQLHAHCYVFNASWDDEQSRWAAVQIGDIKRDAPFYQAVFDSRFARRLGELGLATKRAPKGWGLDGLDKSSLDKFSLRTKQIDELARKKGITDAKARAELGAKTREAKSPTLSMAELRERWRKRLTPDEERCLALQQLAVGGVPIPERAGAAEWALRLAAEHGLERQSVLPERRLLADALRRSVGEAALDRVISTYERAGFINANRDGQRLVTTREVLAEESRMLAFARAGRGTCPAIDPKEPAFPEVNFNAEQRAAVLHVLRSRDRVILMRGAAGTGKSDTLLVARQAIENAGHQVFAFAPSATASRGELRKKGFASADTIALLLHDKALQAKVQRSVWWIDEAGLVGTKDMNALFGLAEKLGSRLVLAGDRFQHGSVPRGAALRLLEEEAGLAPVQLKEIVRQRDQYKAVVHDLSEGRVAQGFARLDALGWIREIPDEERVDALASAYVAALKDKKEALVVAPTHAEGKLVTAAIRHRLSENGLLGQDEQEFLQLTPRDLTLGDRKDPVSYQPGDVLVFHQNAVGFDKGQRVAVAEAPVPLDQAQRYGVFRSERIPLAAGDRIRITRNGFTNLGRHRLNNGELFTVKGFAENGDLLLGNGWQLQQDYGHIASGFVTTSYGSQSKTVDRVFIAQSKLSIPASSREQFYVSVSRGREQAFVFTDDRKHLLEAVSRSDPRMSATELVTGRGHSRQPSRPSALEAPGVTSSAKPELAHEL